MRDYIAWYLVEVERAAKHRVSRERADEVLREIKSHLTDATGDLVAQGMAEEDAARTAVAKLGHPDALFGERTKTLFWGSPWLPLVWTPLYISAMTLAEVGVDPFPIFLVIALILLIPIIDGFKLRRVHTRSIALVPLTSAVFVLFTLPAWFVDIGKADGFYIVPRVLLANHAYDLQTRETVSQFSHTYWEQLVGFAPSAIGTLVIVFCLVAIPHVLGVWLGKAIDRLRRSNWDLASN